MTSRPQPQFRTKLAETQAEFLAAQRLRYDVFVEELGATGDMIDHENRLERDVFDPLFDHLLLIDDARGDMGVVGVYRLLPDAKAHNMGRFYSEDEYDLTVLKTSGRRLLELGRSCLHPDYRGGTAMLIMWQALAEYVTSGQFEILFGVASFHGTNVEQLAPALSLLHHRHLAPPDLRPEARVPHDLAMNIINPAEIDRKAAILMVPPLIKAYLKLGGCVGQGAFIDHDFNTIDVCLILDTAVMNSKQKQIYMTGK